MPNAGASAFDRKITQTLGEFDKAQHFLEDRHMIGITSSPSPAINRQSSAAMLGGGVSVGVGSTNSTVPMMGGGSRQQPSAYPYGSAGPPPPQQQHSRHPFAKTMDNKVNNYNNGRSGVSSGYPVAKQPQSQLSAGSGQLQPPPPSMMMNGGVQQRFQQQQQQQQLHQQHNGRSALAPPPLLSASVSAAGSFVKPSAPMHQLMHPSGSATASVAASVVSAGSMMQPPSADNILKMFKTKKVEPLSAIEATPRVELAEQHSVKAHKYADFVPLGGGFPSRPIVAPMLDDLPSEPDLEPLHPEPTVMPLAAVPATAPQM